MGFSILSIYNWMLSDSLNPAAALWDIRVMREGKRFENEYEATE